MSRRHELVWIADKYHKSIIYGVRNSPSMTLFLNKATNWLKSYLSGTDWNKYYCDKYVWVYLWEDKNYPA